MVGPVRGTDRYFGPSAVSREIEAFSGVPIPATVRSVAFIGKGQNTLSVINEALLRAPGTSVDALSRANVQSITSAGTQIDVPTFEVYVPFFNKSTRLGDGNWSNKIEVTLGESAIIEESYDFEVVTVGSSGAGQYRVTTVSTGASTVVQTTNSTYGSELFSGFVFRIADTLGTTVGDIVRVTIDAGFQDGDFTLAEGANTSQLDWSLYSGSAQFAGSIGLPVKDDPASAAIVTSLSRNLSFPSISSGEIMPIGFAPTTLDDAVYTAAALSGSTYEVLKTKDGVTTTVIALDVTAGTFTDVLTEATAYVFDGMLLNLSVTTPGTDSVRWKTVASLFAKPHNGLDEAGLMSNLMVIPRVDSTTSTESYRVRVVRSDSEGFGTYVIVPESTNLLSNEIITTRTVSSTLFAGLDFRLADTRLTTLTSTNLMLNSSFVDGVASNPINWTLGGGATIDTTVADTPYGSRSLRLTQTTSLTGATGTLFTFPEVTAPTAFTFVVSGITDGVLVGGLTGTITWQRIDNTTAGTATITTETSFNTSWSRVGLTLSSSNIPVGAVKGVVNLYNTDTTVSIWLNAIQIMVGAAGAYKESDIALFKTQQHEVPASPNLTLEKRELSPSYSVIDQNVELSLLPSQSTVKERWFLRVVDTTTFQVIRKSTGAVLTGNVGISYPGNLIPGVLVYCPNSFSATDRNDVLEISTLASFNRTKTISSVPYYVSYTYSRASNDYYIPKTFFQPAEVYQEMGIANPNNSLSLAVSLCDQNGAQAFTLVQMDETNDWTRAYEALERVGTNYIVPLLSIDTVSDGDGTDTPTQQQYLNALQILREGEAHCKRLSSILEKKERVLWGSNLRGRDVQGMIFDAQTLKCDRVVYIGPTSAEKEFTDSVTLEKTDLTLDGCYIAAAAVGLRLAQTDVAVPLTRKGIVGFKRLASLFLTDVEKDLLGGNGVFLLNDTGGNFQIRHAVTTDPTNALTQEQSVRDIADYTSVRVRNALDQLFIGKKLLSESVNNIRQATKEILSALQGAEIISGFGSLVVNRDEREPRTVNVRFDISPVLPLNWILIEFTLKR